MNKRKITIEDMEFDLCDSNLDTEYREALAHSLMKLKYLSDSPLKLSMGTDKQREELKKVYEKPLNAKQIKEIVSYMSNEMKGDFQYGCFTSFISKYINIAKEMEKSKKIRER